MLVAAPGMKVLAAPPVETPAAVVVAAPPKPVTAGLVADAVGPDVDDMVLEIEVLPR